MKSAMIPPLTRVPVDCYLFPGSCLRILYNKAIVHRDATRASLDRYIAGDGREKNSYGAGPGIAKARFVPPPPPPPVVVYPVSGL